MKFIGEILGLIALAGVGGSIFNYCIKLFAKYLRVNNITNTTITSISKLLLEIFVKRHRLWGMMAFTGMLSHAILQYLVYGVVWSGLLAAVVLLTQCVIGYSIAKHPSAKALKAHRILAIIMFITLAIHWIHIEFF